MTTTVLNTKMGEVKNKIPNATGLATTAVFSRKIEETKNKIPDVSGLVKKADFNAKMSNINKKYFTSSDYNKLTSGIFDKTK